jgi:cytochrome d ubiquinol oxidase subunit I
MLFSGHLQAKSVAEHQPAKLAAFEGHYKTGEGGAPLYLFGFPSEEEQRVKFGMAVPGALSFLVHEDFSKPIPGLDRFKPEDRPSGNMVALSFQTYHLMVGLGFFFIALTLFGSWMHWKGKLYQTRWLLWVFVFAVVGAFIGNETGWMSAELGRQPWVVYPAFTPAADGTGVWTATQGLRTANAVSPSVPASQMLISLLLFLVIYGLLFAVWAYVLDHKIKQGPDLAPAAPDATSMGGLMEAAARRGEGSDYSLTEPRGKE